ncbi:MAG: carboxypeptidase-like regulatory domain-containing protein, partial [Vicinamibacterales bacterium]
MRVCTAVLLCLGTSMTLVAQIGGGALVGRVVDHSGAALPGATVTATATKTNFSWTFVTAEDGGYVFQGLAPGTYQLHIELNGFRSLTRRGIGIATGETV